MVDFRTGKRLMGAVEPRLIVGGLAAVVIVVLGLVLMPRRGGDESSSQQTPAAESSTPRPTADRADAPRGEQLPILTPPTARSEAAPMRLRVLAAEDDSPLTGATVKLVVITGAPGLAMLGRIPDPHLERQTDAEGRVEIDGPDAWPTARHYTLQFASEGRVGLGAGFPQKPGAQEEEIVVRLEAGRPVRFITESNLGVRIPAAQVGSFQVQSGSAEVEKVAGGISYPSISGETDDNGTAVLHVPVSSGRLNAFGRKDGFLGASERMAPDAEEVLLVLERGETTLFGRVLTAEEVPVPNATISLTRTETGGRARFGLPVASATSDAEGRYRIEGLVKGSFGINFALVNEANPQSSESGYLSLTLPESGEVERDLKFAAKRLLVGRALLDPGDTPLPNIEVRPGGGGLPHETRPRPDSPRAGDGSVVASDSDGRFTLTVTESQWVNMDVRAPRGLLPVRPMGNMGNFSFRPIPPEGEELILRFKRGRTVALRFEGPEGNPLSAEADLSVSETAGVNIAQYKVAPGDPVVITAVIDGATMLEANSGTLFASIELGPNEGSTEEPTVIRLGRKLTIRGIVLDPDGNPVANAAVIHSRERTNQRGASTTHYMGAGSPMSDAEGRFELADLPPGFRYNLTAQPPEGDTMLSTSKSAVVDLTEAGEAPEVTLTLQRGEAIEGIVVDAQGAPIEGANIRAHFNFASHAPPPTIRSDADGRFVVTGFPEGASISHLQVDAAGYSPATRQNVNALDGELRIVLERSTTVNLLVRDPVGNTPVADYDYILYGHAWTETSAESAVRVKSPDGRAVLTVAGAQGRRIVAAERGEDGIPTGRRGAVRFTPKAGETMEVTVDLEEGRTIRGRVVVGEDPDVQPVAKATVSIETAPEWQRGNNVIFGISQPARGAIAYERSITDKDGRFAISGLVTGTYELGVDAPAGLALLEAVSVEVSPNKDPDEVVLRLSRPARIVGKVIGFDGQPIKDITVQFFSHRGGRQNSVTTDAQGGFVFENVPPGQGSVSVYDMDLGLAESRLVTIEGTSEEEVIFDLTGMVLVTGKVLLQGNPIASRIAYGGHFRAIEEDGSDGSQSFFQLASDSTYNKRLSAGLYRTSLQMTSNSLLGGEKVTIPEGVETYTLDLEFFSTTLDVAIDMPDGAPVPAGMLTLNQRNEETGSVGGMGSMWSAGLGRRHFPAVGPGTYQAVYRSSEGLYQGSSEWSVVSVEEDAVNLLYIAVQPATDERAQLARVQQALRDAGLDAGPIDGLMGPMTEGAIRRYQEQNNLPVTGTADAATLNALGVGGGAE